MLCFIQEVGGEDLEDKAVEWKAKITNNNPTRFRMFFITHDNVIQDLNKHTQLGARDNDFDSTNNIKEPEDHFTNLGY